VSHAAVKSFDRRGFSCNARTVQFSGGVEKCPVTQKTALPLANCSTHELQLNWTHCHRSSRVRCEEHRAWPTTTSVDAVGNQHCSHATLQGVRILSAMLKIVFAIFWALTSGGFRIVSDTLVSQKMDKNGQLINNSLLELSLHFYFAKTVIFSFFVCARALSHWVTQTRSSSNKFKVKSQFLSRVSTQHTDARYWYSNSLCLPVCPWRSWIRWKLLNILS